jgi:exopolyphosphatase/guanosine-5'-triphosphate,3'-diphosphate pyrophosphatase
MIISRVSMRDGLLLELARSATGAEDPALVEGIVHSAKSLAEKYLVSMDHAEQVAALAVRLFDELQADHGLRPRHRLLLQIACLLHEVGGYVNSQAHHKHSYYLIRNSEIFGLNRSDVEIVAHIARYHRRSTPKLSHVEFMSLPRESRVVISKLAAILRVADALSRSPIKHVGGVRFLRQEDDLIIQMPAQRGLMLEERALALKADMFEDIFGLKVRVEEA